MAELNVSHNFFILSNLFRDSRRKRIAEENGYDPNYFNIIHDFLDRTEDKYYKDLTPAELGELLVAMRSYVTYTIE